MRQSRKAFELFSMFLTRRPSPQKIKQFLERSQGLPLSYEPIGITRESPRGYQIDEAGSIIGHGEESFARAKQALTNWKQFELGWVELHPPGAPDTKRADHLSNVTVPMLFLSGTRDQFSEGLIGPVVESLGKRATLHLLDTADHSFKVLKRTRTSTEDVFGEAARVTAEWAAQLS